MNFSEKLAAAQRAIRALHLDESLTSQDRAQCMIADDLLQNLSPQRAIRENALSELAALDAEMISEHNEERN